MQSLKKILSTLILLSLLSQGTQAQFSKWVNKAKDKALEKINGKKATDSSAAKKDTTTAAAASSDPATVTNDGSGGSNDVASKMPPPPKPIEFPHTGVTVKGIRGTFEPVIDGDVTKISNTPAGKATFEEARAKGLKGSDADVFRQLIDPKNAEIMKAISADLEAKYPEMKGSGSSSMQGFNFSMGGMSAPSIFFEVMAGTFDTWITSGFIKSVMNHDRQSFASAFGVNAAGIMDLNKHLDYVIGSVFGVNFTTIDTIDNTYGINAVVKKEYFSLPGVKTGPGAAGKFGTYTTTSDKVSVPVQPFTDKETGKKSDALLFLHDILSGNQNMGVKHYDPSYQLVFVYYFTHDLDKYLPGSKTGMLSSKGLCIGASVEDEKGNKAIWRLDNVQTNVDIDQGEFQIPADYPIMTKEERHQAIRAKMGLKK